MAYSNSAGARTEEDFKAIFEHATAEQYHAGDFNADKEPFLLDVEALEFDMWPWVPIWDVMIARGEDGEVTVVTPNKDRTVPADQTIFLRG